MFRSSIILILLIRFSYEIIINFKISVPELFFMLATLAVMGQEKVNISAGLGAPELLNVGIRYQMGQSQLGLGAGIAPGSDEKAFSVGVDYFYHAFGSNSLSPRRPWYGRIGLYHYAFEDEFQDTKLLLLVPRIGKDFNLSPKTKGGKMTLPSALVSAFFTVCRIFLGAIANFYCHHPILQC